MASAASSPAARACAPTEPVDSVDSDSSDATLEYRTCRKRRRVDEQDLPPGPPGYEEMFNRPKHIVGNILEKLSTQGIELEEKKLKVYITSSYAGIGLAEMAAEQVVTAMMNCGLEVELVLYSQTESDPPCRPFLRAHHVFSNVISRVSKTVWNQLLALQSWHFGRCEDELRDAGQHLGGGPKRKRPAITAVWNHLFYRQAVELLNANKAEFTNMGYCQVCQKQCMWTPPLQQELGRNACRTIWLELSGDVPWATWTCRACQLSSGAGHLVHLLGLLMSF